MPAIKLKKVTAEYLAEKEKEEKAKEKAKKDLENVSKEENAEKEVAKEVEEEDSKTHNFLEVEILHDKRKRTLPQSEQKLIDWLDSNLIKKENVTLPLGVLYEYYADLCQTQGLGVVDVPLFNKYVRDRFGKTFGFQENSPYSVLIKEKTVTSKPKVQGETAQMKLRDVLTEILNEIGNPRKGVKFGSISKAIMHKYPALRVDIHHKKLIQALERGVAARYMECTKGVGRCGFYRLPGEPTKEEPEEKDKKKKKTKNEEAKGEEAKEDEKENGDAAESVSEDKSGEDKSTDDEKNEDGEKKTEETSGELTEKKPKKKSGKKKKKNVEKWARGGLARHSDPERFEDVFPLAITYQSDPKETTGAKIKNYIAKYYRIEVGQDELKKALDKGVEKGMWECTGGGVASGRFHLLVEEFNPGRSDALEDQIAQAIVACNEPKQASGIMLKKYIAQYHPKFDVENRLKSFKNALERACEKGLLRQVSGIGSSGSFQLVGNFQPSPAILAGDTSDSEEEDMASDEEEPEYVPRPTKRGRLALKRKPVSASAPQHLSRQKPKQPLRKKAVPGKANRASASKPKYYEVTSESESEGELEVSYTPSPSKSRGGSKTPARSEAPAKETKSSAKRTGKAASQKKKVETTPVERPTGRSKRKAAVSPAIVDESDESDLEDEMKTKEKYTPRPSKSRGGSGKTTTPVKTQELTKHKLVEESDADDESDAGPAKPVQKGRNRRVSAERKSYAEVDMEQDGENEEGSAPSPAKKKKTSPVAKTPKSGKRKS